MSHFTGPIWRRGRVKTLSLVCGESSRGLDGLHGTAQLRDEPAWAGPGRDSMIDGTEHHQPQDRGASGLQEESAAQSRCSACTFFTDARAPKAWLGLAARHITPEKLEISHHSLLLWLFYPKDQNGLNL